MLRRETIEQILKVTKDFTLFLMGDRLAIRFGYWDEIDLAKFSHISELKLEKEFVDEDSDCGNLWAYKIIL